MSSSNIKYITLEIAADRAPSWKMRWHKCWKHGKYINKNKFYNVNESRSANWSVEGTWGKHLRSSLISGYIFHLWYIYWLSFLKIPAKFFNVNKFTQKSYKLHFEIRNKMIGCLYWIIIIQWRLVTYWTDEA